MSSIYNNGICKKVGDKRKHQVTPKTDGEGRNFESCDACGFLEVGPFVPEK